MRPIYKFALTVLDTYRYVYPLYKDDLAIDFSLEQSEQFFRGKLSGKLTFLRDDYTFIAGRNFDDKFLLTIYISYDKGATWATYWTGQFWKTDCEIDDDAQTVVVTPTLVDRYTKILAGLEKEFNLIDLAPVISPVKFDRRAAVQVYMPGASVVGCYLAGMWWEQECDPESNTALLASKYHFAVHTYRSFQVTQAGTPILPSVFYGLAPSGSYPQNNSYTSGAYRLIVNATHVNNVYSYDFYLNQISPSVQGLWKGTVTRSSPLPIPTTVSLSPVEGSGAEGNVTLTITDAVIAMRCVTDASVTGTYDIDPDDIVLGTRGYKYVIPYNATDSIAWYNKYTTNPTPWGLYRGISGIYYVSPAGLEEGMGIDEAYPIARQIWDTFSIWFVPNLSYLSLEEDLRKTYTLRDAYPIESVISVLLGQIDPDVSHKGTTAYSEFLYGTNAVKPEQIYLHITPKSNLIYYPYDQPAQKAPITLRAVLDMLRDCYKCYWFIDDSDRLRIEHISWFMRGGSYSTDPVVGTDLTQEQVTRNGKPWAYARKQYSFDKPNMPARFQFGWMDDVSTPFEGYPIDIQSGYVEEGNIEEVSVGQFSSDVDYIQLNPDTISKDGFVLLAAVLSGSEYKLPYYNFGWTYDYGDIVMQNPYAAFIYLQKFYLYDMPAPSASIKDVPLTVLGVRKLKIQNSVKFPALIDLDLMKLVKTELGSGVIQKLSITLSTRGATATLKYDTE